MGLGERREGERAREEREMDYTLIDSIPSMQQQIRSLMRRVAELEAREEAGRIESGATTPPEFGFRDLAA